MFDMDYFNSPAFQQAIAAAVGPRRTAYQAPQAFREGGRSIGGRGEYADDLYDVQDAEQFYNPFPVSDPVYNYDPAPVYNYDYQDIAGIGGIDQFAREDYGLIAPAEEVYVSQGPSAEEIAAAQAEADRAVAQAEADRVAAEQEYFARVEAERLALARAQALEAEAERTQNEAIAARAEQARIAVEQAAAERAAAEQVAAQAQVAEQQAVQTQTVVQEAVQQVAEVQAAEQVYTPAPAAEPFRGIGGRGEYEGDVYAAQVPEVYTPAPEPAPVYTPAPAPAPEPAPVYNAAPEPVRGIGRRDGEGYYEPAMTAEEIYTPAAEVATIQAEPVRTVAAEPTTIEAEPVAGIGSAATAVADIPVAGIGTTAAAAPAATPSVLETAVAAAPATGGPLTQDQYDAMADRRAAANAPPRGTYIAAPTDNLGKTTGFDTPGQAANTFQYRGGPIRVTDRKGKVLFSGEGPEGALEAVKFAQNLSDTKGKNASWDIQEGERTINPDGSVGETRWISGPTDAKEGMGLIGDLAAFALPIAAAILTAGMSLPAQMAIASAAGMVGGVMSGNDPLKAAIIAGVSVGVMDKIGANDFIAKALDNAGTAIGNVFASEVAQEGAKEVIKNAVSEFGEEIVVTAISQTMQGVANSIGNTLLSEVAKGAGLGDVTGYQTPAEKFAEEQLPETLQTSTPPPVEDAIVVSGDRIGAVADTAADVITGIGSGAAADVAATESPAEQPPAEQSPAEQPVADDTIVVSGERAGAVADIVSDVINGIGSALTTDVISGFDTPSEKFVEEPPSEELVSDTQPPADDTIVVTGGEGASVADVLTGIGNSAVADVINGFDTPAEKFVEEPLPDELVSDTQPPADDTIVVTGGEGASVADVLTGIGNSAVADVISGFDTPAEKFVDNPNEDIVVTGRDTAVPIVNPDPNIGKPGVVDPVTGDIVVSKEQPVTDSDKLPPLTITTDPGIGTGSVTDTLGPPDIKSDPNLTDDDSVLDTIKDVADVASVVLPLVGGGGGGGGGTIGPDTSKLNFRTSTLRPTLIGGVGIGGRYPYTPQTYGRAGGDQETEFLFFTRDPVTGEAVVETGPAGGQGAGQGGPPGKKEGGEIEDDMVKHLVEYHKNGGHQGPGQVKGIGSGQEDKIPAWLSDGEYVWSAQDVADLGDGSTDEGVRRLDKMRQMVRRQAGRKDVKKIAKPQKGIDRMLKAVGGLA